jgi:hypothetical protein
MSGDEQIKALHAVRAAHARIAEKVQAERDTVAAARAIGVQWRRIADAVGMSQPNASRKYGPLSAPAGKADEAEAEVALRKVRAANGAIFAAELTEIEAVAAARAVGVTWQAIAEEVGMEQPNAVVKYRPFFEETRTVALQPDAAERLRKLRGRKRGGTGETERPAES